MATRAAPLVPTADGGAAFVRGWGAPAIRRAAVDDLLHRGLVARSGRVFTLTEAGRRRASTTRETR
jgi:hypothetical protein